MMMCLNEKEYERKIMKLNDIKDTLTVEQIQAIQKCHDCLFMAEMGSIYQYDEYKRKAIQNLQEHFSERIVNFIGDFYNSNDTIIFECEVQ